MHYEHIDIITYLPSKGNNYSYCTMLMAVGAYYYHLLHLVNNFSTKSSHLDEHTYFIIQ